MDLWPEIKKVFVISSIIAIPLFVGRVLGDPCQEYLFTAVILLLPITVISFGIYSIKSGHSQMPGGGSMLRGKSGAIASATMNSNPVYGDSAKLTGVIYVLLGVGILMLYGFAWLAVKLS